MKIEKEHIKYIQDRFALMQSRIDFLDLLNYTKPLIYGEEAIKFELKQITFYANSKNTNKAYKEFQIENKSGGYFDDLTKRYQKLVETQKLNHLKALKISFLDQYFKGEL
jgi:hypothetical protein